MLLGGCYIPLGVVRLKSGVQQMQMGLKSPDSHITGENEVAFLITELDYHPNSDTRFTLQATVVVPRLVKWQKDGQFRTPRGRRR
ncbi:hypothetical protein AAHA92_31385 [Salvia divinorum]|uniref:Uncharacterized protein n=1 Tax=Salvia divinorum TaxID=28513 RepID=A0ABD1FQ81_SALDI